MVKFSQALSARQLVAEMLLLLLLFWSPWAGAANIEVTADRNPVAMNESFQLIYQSHQSVDDDPDFSPLEKYLDILNRNQSSSFRYDTSGGYQSSKTWTLTVMARQAGDLTLPAIAFGKDRSPPYQLSVKKASAKQQAQSDFYTRLEVEPQQVYAQQQLVVTQQLFSAYNLSAYGLGDLDFNGKDVVARQLGDEKQYQTRIGDRPFLVIERRIALFPQQSGEMTLSPVMAEARIGSGRSSIFDAFGGGKIKRARSNPLQVKVLPLPDNASSPWLPARKLALSEQWPQQPPHFVQGEPLTRTLIVRADGLTAAQLPELPQLAVDGVKFYPDQPTLDDNSSDSGISGVRVEKVALIPTRAGKITLPAIEIPWWNTQTGKPEVARVPARVIEVQPAASAAQPPAPLTRPANQPSATGQSVPPEQSPAPAAPEARPGPWVWPVLALLFASGWLLTALAWWLRVRRSRSARQIPDSTRARLQQLNAQVKSACGKSDAALCRNAIVAWGRERFTDDAPRNLGDIRARLPEALAAEIGKLDALLYAAEQPVIDYALIRKGIAEQTRMAQKAASSSQDQGLQPLYP